MLGMQGCYPAPIAEQSGSSSQMMKGGDGGEGVTGWRGHIGGTTGRAHFRKTPSLFALRKYQGGSDMGSPRGGFLRRSSSSGIGGPGRAGPSRRGNRAGVGADVPREPSLQGTRAVHPDTPPTPDTSRALQAGRTVAWAGPSVSCQRWRVSMRWPHHPCIPVATTLVLTRRDLSGHMYPGMSHRELCSVKIRCDGKIFIIFQV